MLVLDHHNADLNQFLVKQPLDDICFCPYHVHFIEVNKLLRFHEIWAQPGYALAPPRFCRGLLMLLALFM